mmetsp:Transcript_27078/g.67076  ORF Transcript_27078/g.67076 Transcript_27078/m.67076 type:complete len:274 (-) Transcript_27078:349-1170(-)
MTTLLLGEWRRSLRNYAADPSSLHALDLVENLLQLRLCDTSLLLLLLCQLFELARQTTPRVSWIRCLLHLVVQQLLLPLCAQLLLTLARALLESKLHLLRIGQRRPERSAVLRVANALQPREAALLVVRLEELLQLAQRGSPHRLRLLGGLLHLLVHHAKGCNAALLLQQLDRLLRPLTPRLGHLGHREAKGAPDAGGAVVDRHGAEADLHHGQQLGDDLCRRLDLDRVAWAAHRLARQLVDQVEVHRFGGDEVAQPLPDRLEGTAHVALQSH